MTKNFSFLSGVFHRHRAGRGLLLLGAWGALAPLTLLAQAPTRVAPRPVVGAPTPPPARDLAPGSYPGGYSHAVAARPLVVPTPSWGTVIGRTIYDLQTNSASANRLLKLSNGRLSTVWIQTCDPPGSHFNNRGTGYNQLVNGVWVNGPNGNCPTQTGLNSLRAGWPEVLEAGGKEIVINHAGAVNGTGLTITSRPIAGGTWSISNPLTFTASIGTAGAVATWPRAVAVGNTIHVIYTSNLATNTPQAPSGVGQPMLYARSLNGGTTWDKQNIVLPGMSGANFTVLGGDAYAITARGTTVAIITGQTGGQVRLWKSTDNGTTFTSQQIDGLTASDVFTIGNFNVARAQDQAFALTIDSNGRIHASCGEIIVSVTLAAGVPTYSNTTYMTESHRLLYWNDGELATQGFQPIADSDPFIPANAQFQELATGTDADQTTFAYRNTGQLSMPTMALDAADNLYIVYAGTVAGSSNTMQPNGQPFRELYVIKGTACGGRTRWSEQINIARQLRGVTNGPAISGEESAYPMAEHTVGADNKLHYAWQSDREPGNSLAPVLPSPGVDPEAENAIGYDAIDVSTAPFTEQSPQPYAGTCTFTGSITVVANTPACSGTLTLSATGVPAGFVYAWTGPNNFTSALATPSVPNLSGASSGIYTLRIAQCAGSGCGATASVTRTIVCAPPVATSFTPTSGAVGATVTITGTGLAGATSVLVDGVSWPITGSTATSITVTVPAGALGGTLSVTTGVGTSTLTTNTFCVQYAPTTTGAGRCGDGSLTLTAAGAPTGATYRWYTAATGGTAISGATSATYTTPSLPATTTYYVVIAGGPVGCESASRIAATATIGAVPMATIAASGATAFCQGDAVTLTAAGAGAGGTYQWLLNGQPISGATAATYSATTSGAYSVTATSAGACPGTSAATTVTVNPVAAAPTTTPAGRCGAGALTLTAAGAPAGATYQWYTTATGGTPIAGATGATYTTPSLTTSTTYYVSILTGTCESPRTAVAVAVAAAPSVAIAAGGPTTFCQGESVTLTASGTLAYLWSNGATTPSITVTAAGTYTVTGTGGVGCLPATASTVVTVNPVPSAAFAYPTAGFCLSGANPTPQVTGAAGGTFSATPTGLTLDAATGQVTLSSSTAGTYTVTYAVAGTCPASQTATLTLATPAQAGFTYAADTACVSGGAPVATTLTGAAVAGTFTATPAGLTLDPATGLVTPATSQAGTYTITNTVAGTGACAAATSAAQLTLVVAPIANITATGPLAFCQGDSVRLTASGGRTYQWTTGATTASITVRTGGMYSAVVRGTGGCSVTPQPLTVTVDPRPATPVVSPTQQLSGAILLTSSAPTGNQWYLNGQLVTGATNQTYLVDSVARNGLYTVVVTGAAPTACVSGRSTGVQITVTGLPTTLAATAFALYPNPAHGVVRLRRSGPALTAETVQLFDALGRPVQQFVAPLGVAEVELALPPTLPTGVYLVRCGSAVRRLVID